MNLEQLAQSIIFEGKINDIHSTGGWIYQTILELLDQYASAISYPEFYVSEVEVPLTASIGTVDLPTDILKLDQDSIRYRYQGDEDRDYLLTFSRRAYKNNVGPAQHVFQVGNSLSLFPFATIANGDSLYINYWKKPSSMFIASNFLTLEVPLPALHPTIKAEVITRALVLGGNAKDAPLYRQLSKEAYNRAMGSLPLPDVNNQ